MDVIYGDTDSPFFEKTLLRPRLDIISIWARSNLLGVDLEIDKQYRYVVLVI